MKYLKHINEANYKVSKLEAYFKDKINHKLILDLCDLSLPIIDEGLYLNIVVRAYDSNTIIYDYLFSNDKIIDIDNGFTRNGGGVYAGDVYGNRIYGDSFYTIKEKYDKRGLVYEYKFNSNSYSVYARMKNDVKKEIDSIIKELYPNERIVYNDYLY